MFGRKKKERPVFQPDPRLTKATGSVVMAAQELRAAIAEATKKETLTGGVESERR